MKKEILYIKYAFDYLINRLGMAKEKISEFQGMPIETSKTENQREKTENKKTEQHTQNLLHNYKRHKNPQWDHKKEKKG